MTPPGDARRVARERCRIVLTNPDMLHAGILPNHAKWVATFQNLKYVVLDELHTYRGVFGSHMAHVIARLKRIARFHGSDPVFIAATATIGNPREHAARLFGVIRPTVALVDESGAPRSTRRLFIYNPPVVNAELGIRASALKQSVNLAATLVRARVPTIVFGPSRNSVEVMLKYLRAKCGDVAGADAIMAYRGGYLPETRRAVERGLREGQILCVVATNALELGIDIGDLDAVVCAGYPGSVAATWQRFGRAGRRGDGSIAVMVCGSSPLDQYLARDPSYLLGAPRGGSAHRSGQRGGAHPAPEVRRVRSARSSFRPPARARRTLRPPRAKRICPSMPAPRGTPWTTWPATAWCTKAAASTTGRARRSRPTTSRCATSAGTTS